MKEHIPPISVVLTTYNHQKYVGDAIQSVLNQTFEDFELIIVNDGSTDQTDKIIRKFNDSRINYIFQQNQGTAFALNQAILASKGKYIVNIDSDDLCYHKRLEKQYNFISNSEYKIIFSQADLIDEDGNMLDNDDDSLFNFNNRERAKMLRYFFEHHNYLCASSFMAEKYILLEAKLFCLTLIQLSDFDMWIKLLKKYELFIMPEKLVKYRFRSNKANITFNPTNNNRHDFELHNICKKAFDDMPIKLFKEAFQDILKKPDFNEGIEYELEKAFLCIDHSEMIVRNVGLEKLYKLLQNQNALSIAIKKYDFNLPDFFKLTLEYNSKL
jgi:glycosyltransferase involved in cell wall biosynthesis